MWAYNETFYQIYPIGFCGAPVHNDGVTEHRILKIGEWAEYLGDLGIGSIILNPIFESDNHGYDTRDFRKIDCRLGTNEDFKEVCEKLHDNNVKIMLDGVFNHVGRGFWHSRMCRRRNGTLRIKTGSISASTGTVRITMVSGMKDGKVILNLLN